MLKRSDDWRLASTSIIILIVKVRLGRDGSWVDDIALRRGDG